jgi:uncharacterized membrane protein
MNNRKLQGYKYVLFGTLSLLLILISLVSFFTFIYHDITIADPLIFWAIQNHLLIMVVLVIISVSFGFMWAVISGEQLKESKNQTKNMLDVLLLFLSTEERLILNYLVDNLGNANQADISRLSDMGRVKAYRSLQRMEEKGIVSITPHGKIRKISLKENIFEVIKENK